MLNRHNLGFLALDCFAMELGASQWKSEHKASVLKTSWKDHQILLVKPQTYMNLSGESVQAIKNYYRIDEKADLLVIHDEVDQEFGQLKFQRNRGHGGHNGVRDIHEKLGHSDYSRLRVGVGRPPHPNMAVADWLLQDFTREEQTVLSDQLFNLIVESFYVWIDQGFEKAATQFNQKLELK